MNYVPVTVEQWLGKVHANNAALRSLIRDWHPAAHQKVVSDVDMPITAAGAERACQVVREKIRQEEPTDPLARWDKAIETGDVGEIMSLLNGAWFGVPESTSCWGITGFTEAVDLLDDPPEEPEQGASE